MTGRPESEPPPLAPLIVKARRAPSLAASAVQAVELTPEEQVLDSSYRNRRSGSVPLATTEASAASRYVS